VGLATVWLLGGIPTNHAPISDQFVVLKWDRIHLVGTWGGWPRVPEPRSGTSGEVLILGLHQLYFIRSVPQGGNPKICLLDAETSGDLRGGRGADFREQAPGGCSRGARRKAKKRGKDSEPGGGSRRGGVGGWFKAEPGTSTPEDTTLTLKKGDKNRGTRKKNAAYWTRRVGTFSRCGGGMDVSRGSLKSFSRPRNGGAAH